MSVSGFFLRPDAYISIGQPGRVRVSELTVRAPEHMAGLRAVFLSDVHLWRGASDAWLRALMAQIESARADVLLLGGDYAERPAQQRRFFEAIGGLPRPRLGAYAVLGNNDSECFSEAGQLRRLAAQNGVRLLVNEREVLSLPGGRLAIAGLDEEKHGRPNTKRLFDGCGPGAYRLLLSHFPRWPAAHADLVLCGHTHGGQFNLFGITPFSVGFENCGYALVRGVETRAGTTLLVSRGLGCSRIPLRIGVFPEIHLVHFSK